MKEALRYLRTAYSMCESANDYLQIMCCCRTNYYFDTLENKAFKKWRNTLGNYSDLKIELQRLSSHSDLIKEMQKFCSIWTNFGDKYTDEDRVKFLVEKYPSLRYVILHGELSRDSSRKFSQDVINLLDGLRTKIHELAYTRIRACVSDYGFDEAFCSVEEYCSETNKQFFYKKTFTECMARLLVKVATFEQAHQVYKKFGGEEAKKLMNKFAVSYDDKYECWLLIYCWSKEYDDMYSSLVYICPTEPQLQILWDEHLRRIKSSDNIINGSKRGYLADAGYATFIRLVQINPNYKFVPETNKWITELKSQIDYNYRFEDGELPNLTSFYKIRLTTVTP